MQKIFITGVSGTGKTTIWKELLRRGVDAISLDEVEGLCVWRNRLTREVVDYEAELNEEFINSHEWICDVTKLRDLMAGSERNVFVLGSASNQDEFIHEFDKIIVLQCSPETFIRRIMERADNDFGKDESAQAVILGWYEKFEKNLLEKGATAVNVEKPLGDVVDEIMELI